MITRQLVKAELDKVQDRYLELIYRIIQAIASPPELVIGMSSQGTISNWHQFIEETYGSLANDPIERREQGQYEIREAII